MSTAPVKPKNVNLNCLQLPEVPQKLFGLPKQVRVIHTSTPLAVNARVSGSVARRYACAAVARANNPSHCIAVTNCSRA